jgi:hypothetical protein
MSVSSEVQRTLVKSPPELWAELSSPEALARHLGDFGDIKITSVEPETKVEWESEDASGVVHLKQSGWGTKVTLAVTRTPPTPEGPAEPEPAVEPVATVVEPEPVFEPLAEVVEPGPVARPQAAAAEPELPVAPERTPEPEPVATVKPKPLPEPEPEPQLGFFARLFRKRKTKPVAACQPEPEPEPVLTPEVEIEVVAMAIPEQIYPEPPPEPVVDLAAELASVEAQMTEETTELLTGVLDRLGAAHHRPFSRG